MSEIYQEYAAQTDERLDIQPDKGLIRNVKIIGLISRNGRLYPESVLKESAILYEGAKVNVNHSLGGSVNSVRDYRDRIGAIERVQFKPEKGLFADFRFNPRHPLAQQLIWDAQNAPGNVGFSHCVEAATKREKDKTIIEKIYRVFSVDLVADPATTNGLFEQRENAETSNASKSTPERDTKISPEHEMKNSPEQTTRQMEDATDIPPTSEHRNVDPQDSAIRRLAVIESRLQALDSLSQQLSELKSILENRLKRTDFDQPVCSASSWQQTSQRPETTEDFVKRIRN